MQETDKIWMNGEFVDWADARIHVGTHGLHYGTGVFEGIRCYETAAGPAVFRLQDHLERLENSAKVLYIDMPYSVAELRAATHELIAANGIGTCYVRPMAFFGYGELAVGTLGNPVDVVIISFPWGAYLGEEGQQIGITTKISSWERVGPNVIPHAAKATGVYLNSMLATTEARRAGYDEAIMLSGDGYVADGPGENVFVVKNNVVRTPPLSMSILPGITRDTIIHIARDLGYKVEETLLVRSDLYLADEVFMVGTATEVAPVRAVDDREIGVGPITRELQKAYLAAVTGIDDRWRDWLDEREEERVVEVLRSGRLSLGPTIDQFEEAFAEVVGAPFAAAVSSGTAGLHLLCAAAGLGPGDEVITSPYSFVASANCAIYEGATPVFADIDPVTLNLDPTAVEAAVTERTKAIVAVDIYGYPCELAELRALAERHGLTLIEDACEALGAVYRGEPIGSHGPSAVFAFYPNKQMTTGEGGMVTTHSEEERRLLRSLRNQGRADAGGWLEHSRLGFNYRLDDIGAAIGLAQLEKLPEILERRAAAAARYAELLADVDGLGLPCDDDAKHTRSWFVYVVALPENSDREGVIAALDRRGVQTARYLPCIHLQAYMRERYGFAEGLCPVAEAASARTLALPFHTGIDEDDQAYVADALRAALE